MNIEVLNKEFVYYVCLTFVVLILISSVACYIGIEAYHTIIGFNKIFKKRKYDYETCKETFRITSMIGVAFSVLMTFHLHIILDTTLIVLDKGLNHH